WDLHRGKQRLHRREDQLRFKHRPKSIDTTTPTEGGGKRRSFLHKLVALIPMPRRNVAGHLRFTWAAATSPSWATPASLQIPAVSYGAYGAKARC
ncbi:unnamed protein product, partial [Scytosiphon promiscuus]